MLKNKNGFIKSIKLNYLYQDKLVMYQIVLNETTYLLKLSNLLYFMYNIFKIL